MRFVFNTVVLLGFLISYDNIFAFCQKVTMALPMMTD